MSETLDTTAPALELLLQVCIFDFELRLAVVCFNLSPCATFIQDFLFINVFKVSKDAIVCSLLSLFVTTTISHCIIKRSFKKKCYYLCVCYNGHCSFIKYLPKAPDKKFITQIFLSAFSARRGSG